MAARPLTKEELSKYTANLVTKNGNEFHITRDSKIINITKGCEIFHRNYNGDWRQFTDSKTTIRLHRALAEIYIPYPEYLKRQGVDKKSAVVTFKDHNRFNLSVDNLFWCSKQESKIHWSQLGHSSRDIEFDKKSAKTKAKIYDSMFLDKLNGLEYTDIAIKYGASTARVKETLNSFYGELLSFNVDRPLRKRFQALINTAKSQGLYPEMLCLIGKLVNQKNRRIYLKNTEEETKQQAALRIRLNEMG